MRGKPMLYRDQFGSCWTARTVRELHEQIGGRVSKMYRDAPNGVALHVGYVVGQHWCTAYTPWAQPA